MASQFDSIFEQTATPSLLSMFGERITYTPLGGVAARITAIIERGEGARQDSATDGITLRAVDLIRVQVTECPNLSIGDVFTIDGSSFRLEHVPKRYEAGWATVAAEDMRYVEKSDGGIRRIGR